MWKQNGTTMNSKRPRLRTSFNGMVLNNEKEELHFMYTLCRRNVNKEDKMFNLFQRHILQKENETDDKKMANYKNVGI
jgi:hypothetical protein